MAAGYNLKAFFKAFVTTEKKAWFSYEYLQDLQQLEETQQTIQEFLISTDFLVYFFCSLTWNQEKIIMKGFKSRCTETNILPTRRSLWCYHRKHILKRKT